MEKGQEDEGGRRFVALRRSLLASGVAPRPVLDCRVFLFEPGLLSGLSRVLPGYPGYCRSFIRVVPGLAGSFIRVTPGLSGSFIRVILPADRPSRRW